MKIKEVINEGKLSGFVSGFAKGFAKNIKPKNMQNIPGRDTGPVDYGTYDEPDQTPQVPVEPPPLPPNVDTAQNIPAGHRLVVTNPQKTAKFYKYPNGQWTDEFGTVMPGSSHAALNQFADAAGRMEKVPTKGKTGKAGVTGFNRGSR